MSGPSGGAGGGTPTPNPTVGSVHVKRPLGAIPAKPASKPAPKKAPKRKR